jgi:rsbT co-antagonist protein RsbR
LQEEHWNTFFDANINEDWFASRRHVGAVHAHIDLPNDIYFAGMSMSGKSLVDQLRRARSTIKDADESADSIIKLIFLDAFVVIEEITRIQREKISSGAKALIEMSTPVTPIWEGILLLPLLGVLDSVRAQDIMDKTLNKITETRAKVFVMDISGVGSMDTSVANQLIKITKATQLMGCETIISGLSPSIARTLVELGVNVGDVRTTATLRDSFELALRATGLDPDLLSKKN